MALRTSRRVCVCMQYLMLHDVNDVNCPGVVRKWKELKVEMSAGRNWECTSVAAGANLKGVLGIGIIENPVNRPN